MSHQMLEFHDDAVVLTHCVRFLSLKIHSGITWYRKTSKLIPVSLSLSVCVDVDDIEMPLNLCRNEF